MVASQGREGPARERVGSANRTRFDRHWPLLLLLGLTALLYARSLGYPFVNWDDPLHVYRNPAVMQPEKLDWSERWLPRGLGYPMPVTLLSYRVDAALHLDRERPVQMIDGRGFHWTNVALALLLSALAWALAKELLGRGLIALLCCALFVVHPLLVEPIAWITGRKDLLAVVLGLAALLSWLRWLRHPRLGSAIAFALLGLLALAAKPLAVFVAPLAAYLFCCYRPRPLEAGAPAPPARPARLAGFAALALLVLASAALILIARDWNTSVGGVQSDLSAGQTLRRALWALGFHLRLAVAPTILRPKYIVGPAGWSAYDLAGGVLVLLCLAGLLWRRRNAGPIGAGLALFLCSYLPVSNLVPLRRYVADTYMLLPLLGLLLALAGVAQLDIWPRGRLLRIAATAATATIVAMLATLSALQLPSWRDSTQLWGRALAFHPDSPKLCRMLGHAHNERGERAQAIAVYHRCSERLGLGLFANNLAITHYLEGHYEDAERLFRWIIARRPGDPRALKYLALIAKQRAAPPTSRPGIQAPPERQRHGGAAPQSPDPKR